MALQGDTSLAGDRGTRLSVSPSARSCRHRPPRLARPAFRITWRRPITHAVLGWNPGLSPPLPRSRRSAARSRLGPLSGRLAMLGACVRLWPVDEQVVAYFYVAISSAENRGCAACNRRGRPSRQTSMKRLPVPRVSGAGGLPACAFTVTARSDLASVFQKPGRRPVPGAGMRRSREVVCRGYRLFDGQRRVAVVRRSAGLFSERCAQIIPLSTPTAAGRRAEGGGITLLIRVQVCSQASLPGA